MYTGHVQTVFSLFSASLRPSIFPRKFVLMCIVLSYLSVDTVHHILLYTVVYGTHSGWCRQERNKVARELKHKVFCLVWSVLKEVLVKKAENDSPSCFSRLRMSLCYLTSISVLLICTIHSQLCSHNLQNMVQTIILSYFLLCAVHLTQGFIYEKMLYGS